MASARDQALAQLDSQALPHWRAGLITRHVSGEVDDPRDRALADQLYVAVVKNLLRLQMLTAHHSGRALKSIDPLVQKIVALGLAQMRVLSRIPESAAVNEAVNQAKRFGRARAAGFVNAVLRKAAREADPPEPDPVKAPELYARDVLSHPVELFERLAARVGAEQAIGICRRNNEAPPSIVRLFPGVGPEALAGEGVSVEAHQRPGLYVVQGVRGDTLARWAGEGLAQVQDPTAARVVEALGLEPGQVVLDRCCGLGTKTLQMRDGVGPAGVVYAVDPSEVRMRLLGRVVEERGLGNVRLRRVGMLTELGPGDPAVFDAVLVDAPCSNSGVLGRRAEARYTQSDKALASLAKLQDRILDDTAARVRPGGNLVYSTCSIWVEENRARVDAFLARHRDFHFERQSEVIPSGEGDATGYHDGGYFAVLGR